METNELDAGRHVLSDPAGAGPGAVTGHTTIHLVDAKNHAPRRRVVLCGTEQIGANASLALAEDVADGLDVCEICADKADLA